MRRFIWLVVVFSMIIVSQEQARAEEYSYVRTSVLGIASDVLTTVNGEEIELEAKAYIKSGRTMVPIRFLESTLGAKVSWEPNTRTVIVSLKDNEIKVTADNNVACVNGEPVQLDVAAEIKNNRLFVPLRFIGENLGARVTYMGQAISLVYIDKTGWKDFADHEMEMWFKYPSEWAVNDTVYSGVEFTTPNGCIIKLMKETGTYLEVAKVKRNTLLKEGFKKSFEEPVAGPLYKGVELAYEKDYIHECFMRIFVVGDTVYSLEYRGEDRLDTIYFDVPLYDEIWLSIQEE